MKRYTVKQLAWLSGVSVRALHHYDAIGLLKPAHVGDNRYRYYGRDELLRLQDILFHRELGVPLQDIALLLAADTRDRLAILHAHRTALTERVERSRELLRTLDRTIAELNGARTMDDKDLYQGFAPAKQTEYEDWLVERFGDGVRDEIEAGKAEAAALGREGMAARLAEGEAAGAALAEVFVAGAAPEDAAHDALLARHHAWITTMWSKPCPPDAYAGLADLYLAHPDFRANFDRAGDGFTDWLAAAMKAYAGRIA